MNVSGLIERPRILAMLTLVFAFVPAWLSLVTFRDARQKDGRLFEASAQILGAQLNSSFNRHDYMIGVLRDQARGLDDAALAAGRLAVTGFDWKGQLPHLLAFGYADWSDERLIVRWKSDERAAVAQVGDDLASDARVRAGLQARPRGGRAATVGVVLDQHRMLVLAAVLATGKVSETRGFVLGWLDLDSFCRDASLSQIRDGVLAAAPVVKEERVADSSQRVKVGETNMEWAAAIVRGPRFDQEYGAPTPWLAFLAAGLSTFPLLALAMLAGRASRLRADLAAEREVVKQQRFFTQSVSHEFRTPLGIILSGTELLESYEGRLSPERRSEVLREIKDCTEQMNEMLEHVLLLGRIEAGRLPCERKPVQLAELCRDLVQKAERSGRGRCSVSVDVPAAEAMLDAKLIASILGNLLSNAIKYSTPGGRVTLAARVEPSQLIFEVRDQGIGIPAQDLQRITDPFQRGANVGDISGSGLGLAIAQRCTALHGGTLKLESEHGRGTVATVILPTP